MKILAVNTGSTSCKLDLYHVDQQGSQHVRSYHDSPQQVSPEEALKAIAPDAGEIDAVVHRVVHGGRELVASCLIDNDTERKLPYSTPPILPTCQPRQVAMRYRGIQPMNLAYAVTAFMVLPTGPCGNGGVRCGRIYQKAENSFPFNWAEVVP
jgi:acetate kinase